MPLPFDFLNAVKPFILKSDFDLYEAHKVTSTNDWAWEHYDLAAQRGVAKASLFRADTQTHGRGTKDRRWESPDGAGVYCSLMYPMTEEINANGIPRGLVPMYSEISALAMWICLAQCFPALSQELYIRGVNDIYARHCKLGGILVETKMSSNGNLHALVTGVGVNVYKPSDFRVPDERNAPISIQELLPPHQQADMMTPQQLAYMVGKTMTGLYDMLHQGYLFDYDRYFQMIKGIDI